MGAPATINNGGRNLDSNASGYDPVTGQRLESTAQEFPNPNRYLHKPIRDFVFDAVVQPITGQTREFAFLISADTSDAAQQIYLKVQQNLTDALVNNGILNPGEFEFKINSNEQGADQKTRMSCEMALKLPTKTFTVDELSERAKRARDFSDINLNVEFASILQHHWRKVSTPCPELGGENPMIAGFTDEESLEMARAALEETLRSIISNDIIVDIKTLPNMNNHISALANIHYRTSASGAMVARTMTKLDAAEIRARHADLIPT